MAEALDPSQSTLSPNFDQYVYNMLGKGEAAANLPFQEYTGQRFAVSPLQQQAFSGIGSLAPSSALQTGINLAQSAGQQAQGLGAYGPTSFTSGFQAPGAFQAGRFASGLGPVGDVQSYMNPYIQNVLDVNKREAARQSDILRNQTQARLAQAGAYGGGRQAVLEGMRQRDVSQQMEDIQARGMNEAYDRATQARQQAAQMGLQAQQMGEQSRQFGAQQGLTTAQLASQFGLDAQRAAEQSRQFGAGYGLDALRNQLSAAQSLGTLGQAQFGQSLDALKTQMGAGEQERAIAQQPLDFGYQQWQESMKYPYQQATYMQSLLGGLPLQATRGDTGQSGLMAMLQGGLGGLSLYQALFGGNKPW